MLQLRGLLRQVDQDDLFKQHHASVRQRRASGGHACT
jgi:hypothetical protein